MPRIGRPKAELTVTQDERVELERLTKRIRTNRDLAFRARIILACSKEPSNSVVARRLRCTNQTVGKWRNRFIKHRLDGLYDEPRVGGPRKITDEQVEEIIVKTLETKPEGHTHWSTRKMAEKAGLSHTMIGRIWRTFGLKPHVSESFKLSPDPQLVAKVRDVVGLYMNPPANAVVFAVDEKSQIQALERAQPVLPMDLGQPERQTHNYVRNGTLDLFAALNVATGEVIARCKPQHRAQDFVGFLRDLDAHVEPELEDIPVEALCETPRIKHFAWRIEDLVMHGGFALVTGDVGAGKSAALRLLASKLSPLRDGVLAARMREPLSRVA
jgi:transposase